MKHGIKIPTQYKEEMLNFLREGPPEGAAPGWIDWGDLVPSSSDDDDNGDSSSEASADDSDSGVDYAPFLTLPKNKNGRKCRCGSDTHCTTQSHACPLNPRNRRAVCICRHPNPKPHSLAHSLTHSHLHSHSHSHDRGVKNPMTNRAATPMRNRATTPMTIRRNKPR